MLIRTLLKRREAWWSLTDKVEEANFIWTQIKVNSVFMGQVKSEVLPENVAKILEE